MIYDSKFATASRRFDRRYKIFSKLVFAWFALCLLLAVGVVASIGYVAFHPELIGEYIGRIEAGAEGAAS